MKFFKRYKNINWEAQNLNKLSRRHLMRAAIEASGMTKEELKDEDKWGLIHTIGTEN